MRKNHHEGNLTITKENAARYATLTSVGGYLYVETEFSAPALTSVGGLSVGAEFSAPALTSVGGSLYVKAEFSAPALYPAGFAAFRVIDGVATVEMSRRRVGGVVVARHRYAKVKDQKLVGDVVYVACGEGDTAAHGKTAIEAISELRFKSEKRDISEFRDLALSTRKTVDEWVIVYRIVTGACQEGCRHFLAGQGKMPKSLTLAEVIKRTRGQYGSENFARVTAGDRAIALLEEGTSA